MDEEGMGISLLPVLRLEVSGGERERGEGRAREREGGRGREEDGMEEEE
jgi:hypothetical protein